jgi:hypothetical protein
VLAGLGLETVLCRHCGKIHSDWLGCDQAVAMSASMSAEAAELTATGSLASGGGAVRIGVSAGSGSLSTLQSAQKPRFDRVAAMAHARQFRRKK